MIPQAWSVGAGCRWRSAAEEGLGTALAGTGEGATWHLEEYLKVLDLWLKRPEQLGKIRRAELVVPTRR